MRKSAQTVIRPDAYYTIAAANGRVLEVADFNTENGASVRLWSYEGQPWQQWQFVEAGDGEYRIRNRFTGKVMDLAMSGVCNGTWVHQWTQTAGAGQRWQIVEAGGGKVKLTGLPPGQKCQLRPLRLLRVGGLEQLVQRQPAQLLQKLQLTVQGALQQRVQLSGSGLPHADGLGLQHSIAQVAAPVGGVLEQSGLKGGYGIAHRAVGGAARLHAVGQV